MRIWNFSQNDEAHRSRESEVEFNSFFRLPDFHSIARPDMKKDELRIYLANILVVIGVGGQVDPAELEGVSSICKNLSASEEDLKFAASAVEAGVHRLTPVGRFSDKIRNLEDMVEASLSAGSPPDAERRLILSFARAISLTQPQINEIVNDVKKRFETANRESFCGSCGKQMPGNSKFCPFCGVGCR